MFISNPDCVFSQTLTHEEATVRGSVDGDPVGSGESLSDQVLGRTLEVIETVLLVPKSASWNQKLFFKAFRRSKMHMGEGGGVNCATSTEVVMRSY